MSHRSIASSIDTFDIPTTNMETSSLLHKERSDSAFEHHDEDSTVWVSNMAAANAQISNTDSTDPFEYVLQRIELIQKSHRDGTKIFLLWKCYEQFKFLLEFVEPSSWLEDAATLWHESKNIQEDTLQIGSLFLRFGRTGKKLPKAKPTQFDTWKRPNVFSTRLTWAVKQFRKTAAAAIACDHNIALVMLGHVIVVLCHNQPAKESDSNSQENSISSYDMMLRELGILEKAGISQEDIRYLIVTFLHNGIDGNAARPAVILGKEVAHPVREETQEDGTRSGDSGAVSSLSSSPPRRPIQRHPALHPQRTENEAKDETE
jgi:hypothetical protein